MSGGTAPAHRHFDTGLQAVAERVVALLGHVPRGIAFRPERTDDDHLRRLVADALN